MTNEERSNISKNKIVDAVLIEFAEKGYDGISLSHFCCNNSISKGKLYHHFEGKDELYFACAEKCYKGLIETLLSFYTNPNESYEKNLHNYFELRQDYFTTYPYRAKIMYHVLLTPPFPLKEQLRALRDEFQTKNSSVLFEILKDIPLERGVSINIITKIFELASNYVNIIYGYPNWDTTENTTRIADNSVDIFDKVMQILLYGVLPREEI